MRASLFVLWFFVFRVVSYLGLRFFRFSGLGLREARAWALEWGSGSQGAAAP